MDPNAKKSTLTPPTNPTPIVPVPPETPQSKSKLKSLMLLEVGLFEIGFVILGLILFFGVLNFFNILSISSLYPNQFGWLPHLEQSKSASQTQTPKQNITPVAVDLTAAKNAVAGKQLANEASYEEISSYISQIKKLYPTTAPISNESTLLNRDITGKLSGFDNKYLQIIGTDGLATNFFYDSDTSFMVADTPLPSANPDSKEVKFTTLTASDLLKTGNLGNFIQVEYTSTISAYLKAVFVTF